MNNVWLQAACPNYFFQFGNVPYGGNSTVLPILASFGTILNRMSAVGGNISRPVVSASDSSTAVSVVTGKRMTLAWFYTNSTIGDNATVVLSAPCSCSWVAVSTTDWSVLGTGSATVARLSVKIPPRGWNPVYLLPIASYALQPVYTNLLLSRYSTQPSQASYTLTGPKSASAWLIVQSPSPPITVSSSNTGSIPEFASLSALNRTVDGYSPQQVNLTQTGWFYDGLHNLLYIHARLSYSNTLLVSATPVTTTTATQTVTQTTTATTTNVSTTTASSVTITTRLETTTFTHSTTSTVTTTTESVNTTTVTTPVLPLTSALLVAVGLIGAALIVLYFVLRRRGEGILPLFRRKAI
jgi:hypothetical protein